MKMLKGKEWVKWWDKIDKFEGEDTCIIREPINEYFANF